MPSTIRTAILALLAGASAAQAAVIRVPADQPTIQQAIDAAQRGDEVRVAPGTWFEHIDFHGRRIHVVGEAGPQATILDGAGAAGPVVTAASREGSGTSISGFTIRNGRAAAGGGIEVGGRAWLRVENNDIRGNQACKGGGIHVAHAAAEIVGNRILDNATEGCGGGESGGGVYVWDGHHTVIGGNLVARNRAAASGGGLRLRGTGVVTMHRNIVQDNRAGNDGGGVSSDAASPSLSDNLVVGNRARFTGGGLSFEVPAQASYQARATNNTVADNHAPDGSELHLEDAAGRMSLTNNIFRATHGSFGMHCLGAKRPGFYFNLWWGEGSRSAGNCRDFDRRGYNLVADPMFDTRPGVPPYTLAAGSPAIDAGNTSDAGPLPGDLAGHYRFVDGDGDGADWVDLGAREFVPE